MDASTAPGLSDTLDECARASGVLEMEVHGDMTLGHPSLRDPEAARGPGRPIFG